MLHVLPNLRVKAIEFTKIYVLNVVKIITNIPKQHWIKNHLNNVYNYLQLTNILNYYIICIKQIKNK